MIAGEPRLPAEPHDPQEAGHVALAGGEDGADQQQLGAGVAKALLGRTAVPDDLPFVTGSIGLLGTKPSYDLMMGCDAFLMVGSSFPYSEFLPEEGKARCTRRTR